MTGVMGKLTTLAVLTTLMAALAAASAGAATSGIALSPGGAITQTSLGAVSFRTGEVTLSCRFTLRGTLSSTLVRVEAAIGSISAATVSECNGGTYEVLLNLPWAMRVVGLLEPEARGVCNRLVTVEASSPTNLCGARIAIQGFGIKLLVFGAFANCLYGGLTERLTVLTALARVGGSGREYSLGLLTITSTTLRKASGLFCPETVDVSGGFSAASATQTLTALA